MFTDYNEISAKIEETFDGNFSKKDLLQRIDELSIACELEKRALDGMVSKLSEKYGEKETDSILTQADEIICEELE